MIYLISWISVPFWKYENRKSIQINHVEWKFFKMRAVSIFTSFFQFQVNDFENRSSIIELQVCIDLRMFLQICFGRNSVIVFSSNVL